MRESQVSFTPGEPTSVAFISASPQQVAKAVLFAYRQLRPRFPDLGGPAWHVALCELQPDLLVSGQEITLAFETLSRLAEHLGTGPGPGAPRACGHEAGAADLAPDLLPLYRQASAELPALYAHAVAYGSLVHELLLQLVRASAGVADSPPGAAEPGPPPADRLALATSPAAAEPGPEAAGDEPAVVSGPDQPAPAPAPDAAPDPGVAPARRGAASGAFRDLVQQYPRASGKTGFTVRELCSIMRISAASLTEAYSNPGRLSLNAILALAGAMGTSPLNLIVQLKAATLTKRQHQKGRNRGPRPQ